jgi:hypothetical protein
MAESLKEKVAAALKEAVGEGARIELDDVAGDKIEGLVLSGSFAGQTACDRQDHIWKHLDARLTPFERTRIVFIVTDTRRSGSRPAERRLIERKRQRHDTNATHLPPMAGRPSSPARRIRASRRWPLEANGRQRRAEKEQVVVVPALRDAPPVICTVGDAYRGLPAPRCCWTR